MSDVPKESVTDALRPGPKTPRTLYKKENNL